MMVLRAGDAGWPSQLADLEDHAPARLWVGGDGDLRLLALRSIAIVGSRNASAYGLGVADRWAADLAAAGWTVVSGAAFGIDAAAHRGALTAGGATVAVMAGGVDVAVPAAHARLLRQIGDQGLVVSEHAPGVAARRYSFLERNRLIAALTRATLIVEAAPRSGALNTADWAAALGREVLAVPGPVHSATSRGCHRLIRDGGATLVQDPDEVLARISAVTGQGRPSPGTMGG